MDPHIIELTEDCEIFDPVDLTDHSYNDLFSLYDHLILIIGDEIYEGDFIEGGKDRIELNNVRAHNNPNKLGNNYYFYRNEITEIRRRKNLKEKEQPKPETICALEIQICDEEYERHKEMSKHFVFIQEIGDSYNKAISDISESETLGVVALGAGKCRSLGIGLLVISTFEIVYIFDIITQKSICPEVKRILEDELVCKVFHRGGPQIEILNKKYNTLVTNIYDTEVIGLTIEKNKTNRTSKELQNISDYLTAYFNFPSSLLNDALKTRNSKWFERPLSDRRKLYAAQLGTYLILLKEKMQKRMFVEIQNAMYGVYDYYHNLHDYEFASKFKMTEASEDVNKLIPFLSRHGINVNSELDSKNRSIIRSEEHKTIKGKKKSKDGKKV